MGPEGDEGSSSGRLVDGMVEVGGEADMAVYGSISRCSTYAGKSKVMIKLILVFLDYVHHEFRMKTCWCRWSKEEERRAADVVELLEKGNGRR